MSSASRRHVVFSALGTMTGSAGQATYTSPNAVLESNSGWFRHLIPHSSANALMWGPVGSIGMRWKAFATEDFLSPSEKTRGSDETRNEIQDTYAMLVCCIKPMLLKAHHQIKHPRLHEASVSSLRLDFCSAPRITSISFRASVDCCQLT